MSRGSWALSGRIRRNLAWKLAGTAAEKGLRLGLVVSAARLLGPEAWGRYTYALTLALLFVQLTDLGLSLFLSREVARAGRVDRDFVGQVVALKVVLACGYLALLGALAIAHLDEPVVAGSLLLCAVIALGQTALEAALHVFRGVQDLKLEARAGTVMAAIQVTLGGATLALVWALEWTADQATLAYVAALAAAGLLGAAYSWSMVLELVRPRVRLSASMLRRFRREVLPLGIAIVASLIYYKIDVPMIRALHGDLETGYYTAAYKLLEVLAIVPSVLLAATFPALSETVERDPKQAVALHGATLRWLLLAGGGAAGTITLGAPWIIGLLYGDRFDGAIAMLPALAPSVVLMFVNYLQTHMLVALGLVRQQMLVSLGLVGVNVALNAWWIPLWGGRGAAYATAVTELALLVAVTPLVSRALRRRLADQGALG